MKTVLTLIFFVAITTAVHGQNLIRRATNEEKKGTSEKLILISLDTLRHVHYALAYKDNRPIDGRTMYLDIGDAFQWMVLDEHSRVLTSQSIVRLLNLMTDFGWEFQLPLNDLNIMEGTGVMMRGWLFKRKGRQ